MTYRLARFLGRWSAREDSYGPLIAKTFPTGLAYIALRLQIWHKLVWIRAVKQPYNRLPRLWISRILDERGHKCDCGSGRWIQNDVDGCMAPGCREFHTGMLFLPSHSG